MKKLPQLRTSEVGSRPPTPEEVTSFIESFRGMLDPRQQLPMKLISLKVDQRLLDAFKRKAAMKGIRYQTKIKELMQAWLQADE